MDFMHFEIFTDDFQAPPDESCQKNRKKRRKEKKIYTNFWALFQQSFYQILRAKYNYL